MRPGHVSESVVDALKEAGSFDVISGSTVGAKKLHGVTSEVEQASMWFGALSEGTDELG